MNNLHLQTLARLILSLITTTLFSTILNAQDLPKLRDPENPLISERGFILDSDGGVIYWNEGSLASDALFTTYRSLTGLGALDEMIEVETWKDSITDDEDSPAPELYHTLYQQYHNGIKLEGAEYILHHDGSEVWVSSGTVVENLQVDVTPVVSGSSALQLALEHIGAETWLWDSVDTAYPEGELVIIPFEGEDGTQSFKLVWKFTIVALSPSYNKIIYIDAITGAVLKEVSNVHEDSFNHIYYGTKYDLDSRYENRPWPLNDRWYLFANDNSRNIYTSDDTRHHNYSYASNNKWGWGDMPYSAGDDVWAYDNWSATAAHYCASKSWDYFKQTPLNRNGMTGWGKHIRIVADYKEGGQYINNAYYEPIGGEDYLVISRYNNNYLATYDIIGHEFTHGVTQRSRPLPYEKISGALNESFSDIFGYMVERYSFGYHRNWTIGEDASTTLRDMQNPNSYGDPRFYLQSSFWVNTSCSPSRTNDYCGVHTNSGVPNKWFQLLSTGGTNNVNGSNRGVGGIGADKAARIAYYTLINYTNYDVWNTNFNTVRANSIAAAVILYGMCSNEYNSTCAAWHAVNVGNYCNPCAIAWRNNRFQNALTGVQNKNKAVFDVALYPNPTQHSITLFVEESGLNQNTDYKIDIFDLQGKLVQSVVTKYIHNFEINVQSLPQGVYTVNIVTGDWTKNIKFVKQ